MLSFLRDAPVGAFRGFRGVRVRRTSDGINPCRTETEETKMARKNRIHVPNGTYHVTSRLAERAHWLRDPSFKDKVVSWIHGVAEFTGVQLLAWCVMDNHFHMLVYVPEVPEEYRLDPSESPDAYAFGMRPAECNPPLWSPAGDVPADAAPRRPPTGFTLPDDEMVRRLGALYGEKRADAFARRWERLRAKGQDSTVEAEKEPFLRRMYSLSPFVKTIKERIARHVNTTLERSGHVFEGRFFSGLVEEGRGACMASLYVDYNPVRAGMVADAAEYRWCSFAAAHGGRYAESSRNGYARTFGKEWPEARAAIRRAFADVPDAEAEERVRSGEERLRPSQLIHLRVPELSRGAYVAANVAFAAKTRACLAKGFPSASSGTLLKLVAMVDWGTAAA